ncbi:hypothetical protein CYY_000010 [Polysphondylium violaceum]|uniref:Uncharacterized protein n=1 Tax=Polysphondylium violaceum TaxID=133409 RepID=A0A8J4Q5E5_9MYCE|nr:hypothetical protein CYY_000010 [Polysphondylium violaceum]
MMTQRKKLKIETDSPLFFLANFIATKENDIEQLQLEEEDGDENYYSSDDDYRDDDYSDDDYDKEIKRNFKLHDRSLSLSTKTTTITTTTTTTTTTTSAPFTLTPISIKLPIIIVREIIEKLYFHDPNVKKSKGYFWGRDYALVCWSWFYYWKNTFLSNEFISLSLVREPHQLVDAKNYHLVSALSSIKHLTIPYLQLCPHLIEKINKTLVSLETIKVTNYQDWIGTHLWMLTYLNDLKQCDIVFDFKVDSFFQNDILIRKPRNFKEVYTKKIAKLNLTFDHENIDEYKYTFLKKLLRNHEFKSIEIDAVSSVREYASTHLFIYHSFSRFDLTNCTSLKINTDFIPLFALYNFLKLPNLSTFHFHLQFHLLYELYGLNRQPSTLIPDKWEEFNFFEENMLEKENERVFCQHNLHDIENLEIPVYSKRLFSACLRLLIDNKTINDLAILPVRCQSARHDTPLYEHKQLPYKEQCHKDLIYCFSENLTILKLTFSKHFFNDHHIKQLRQKRPRIMIQEHLFKKNNLIISKPTHTTVHKKHGEEESEIVPPDEHDLLKIYRFASILCYHLDISKQCTELKENQQPFLNVLEKYLLENNHTLPQITPQEELELSNNNNNNPPNEIQTNFNEFGFLNDQNLLQIFNHNNNINMNINNIIYNNLVNHNNNINNNNNNNNHHNIYIYDNGQDDEEDEEV